jgi:porin
VERAASCRGLVRALALGLIFLLGCQTPNSVAAAGGDSGGPSLHEIESGVLDTDFSPGEATSNTPAELDEIYASHEGYLDSLGVNNPFDLLANPLKSLNQSTGLRLGVANTMLYLQPTGGQSSKYGAAGDTDFLSSWTLLGRDTEDTGRLVTTVEYRYRIGDQPPSALGRQIGTLVPVNNGFNDRGWVVRDAYWIQRLFNARLRILFGRGYAADYVGSYWLQNVNNSFVNRNFSANPSIPFPGHGPILGVSLRPTDLYYVTCGVSNANGQTTRNGFDTLFNEWELFSFAEAGFTPSFKNLGSGRYALGLWRMDTRSASGLPSDSGLTAIIDQNLGESLQVFGRYGTSQGMLTNIRQLAQTGLGLSGLLGRKEDLTGAAFSLAQPRLGSSRNEAVVEIFHRFQVSQYSQFSIGMQLIANPGNAPSAASEGIVYARFRASF